MKVIRHLLNIFATVVLFTVATTTINAASDPAKDDAAEIKLGKDASVQIEKEMKLITSGPEYDRVVKIGNKLAEVADSVNVPATWGINRLSKFEYTFKIVDAKDINAFSLPGGFIYINKGLVEAVQSDHELAGVIAHELAHAAHHHRTFIMNEVNRETKGISGLVQLVAAAAMMSRNADAARGLLTGVNAYETSIESKYSVDAEVDADNTAVYYMIKAGYNPVGIYSFMSRLASDEMRHPSIDYGILENHPPSPQRAKNLLAVLEKNNIAVNTREVSSVLNITVKEQDNNGCKSNIVMIDGTTVATLADRQGELSSVRAKEAQDAMDLSLSDNTRVQDVVVGSDNHSVYIAERKVLVFTPEDEALNNKAGRELADSAVSVIRKAIWQNKIDRS